MKKSILSIIIMLMTVVGASAKYIIVKGKVGTCQWYITSDSTLVIEPKDGTNSGDLPEEGWGYDYVANNALMANTPWSQYSDKIVYAVVAPGVNAQVTSWMFGSLSKLKVIDISNLNTENVTYMSCMLKDCVSLTTIFLSNFRTNGQTYMSGMFDGCSNLKTIVSHNATPSALKSGTFESFEKRADCTLLVPVGSKALYGEADGWNELGRIEENKDSLKGTWKIGDDKDYMSFVFDNGNVTVQEYSNGVKVGETVYRYFADSEYLTLSTENDLGIRKYEIKGNSLFVWEDGPDGLPTEYIDVSATSSPLIPADAIASGEVGTCIWYVDAEGMLVIAPKDGENGDLPEDGWNDVDGTPWMPYAESITSARFEPGVNATSLDCMFYKLYNLKDVDFTNFDTQNVTKMNRMFSECRGLEYLDLTDLNTENVKSMYRMIHNCFNLKTLNLTNFQTQYAWDLDELLQNCDSLFTIISDNEEPSLLRYNTFNYFGNCSKATLEVPYGSRMEYMQSDGWRSLGFISDGTEPTFPADVLAKGEVNTCLWYITADSTLVIAPTDGVNGDLPEEGWGGTGYNRVYAPWSDYGEMVKAIVVEDGVNAISCRYMFMEMFAAESADLRGLNTENATDLSYMFLKSSNLKTIDISSLKTDNVEYMESMFDGCYQLESIDVSGFNTQNVVSMNGMFSGCESLTTLDLSSFDVSNVTDMNSMFYYCLNLKTLDITNFTASEETATGWLFSNCDSLSTIISKSKTPTALKSGFFESYDNRADCTLLVPTGSKELYAAADGWNELGNIVEGVDGSDPFEGTWKRTIKDGYVLYIFKNGKVTYQEYVNGVKSDDSDMVLSYSADSEYLHVTFGDESNAIKYEIKGNTLYLWEEGPDSSPYIYINEALAPADPDDPEFPADAIASGEVGTCIWYITNEGKLVVEPKDGVSGDLPEGPYLNYDITENGIYISGGTDLPWDESSIRTIEIKEGVNATSCQGLFAYHDNVESIDLSGLNTDNVQSMAYMFYDCKKLKETNFSSINTQNVSDMTSMFESCEGLTSLDLSMFNTSNVTSMSRMFWFCENLYSVNIDNFDTRNVTDFHCLFEGCYNLTEIDISNINTQNATDVSGMFSSCGELTTIDLSNFDTHNVTNMREMFLGCNSLTSLDLSNFDTQNVTDMSSLFLGCNSLTSLDLSNFNTQNVTSMIDMFGYCDSLKHIISNQDVPSTLKAGTFDSFENRANCTLLVPAGTKELYVQADGWNELGKIDDGTTNPLIPADAIASGEVGTCIWYVTSEGELVIAPADGLSGDLPEEGWVWTQSEVDSTYYTTAPWGEFREKILSASIMAGVNAKSCSNMFCGLSNLQTIDLSKFETDSVTNMQQMFAYCEALTSVDLKKFNTQKVTSMMEMFIKCSALTSLDLSSFDTHNVTDMSSMFMGCSSITSLNVSSFNTQNVTSVLSMFRDCSSLTSLDVNNFDTRNVTDMRFVFINCSALTSLDLSSFNTQNVTDMDQMFFECSALTSLDLSSFNTQNVTDMYEMFYGCSSLTSLDLSNFDTHNVTDMSGMFMRCSSITSLNVSSFNTQNVTSIRSMFRDCTSLTSINLNNFDTRNVTDMRFVFIKCSALTSLDLSSFDTQNVTDMVQMFFKCSALTSLDLSSFKTQNVTNMYDMFYGCSSLTSLDLSNFNTQNVTDMACMFMGCSSITSLNVSSFNTQNVTDMHQMFLECSALTSLDLSNFNTQNVTDMYEMFYGCSSLTSLDLSNFDTQNVTAMYGMFYGCSSLTSLDLSNFDTHNVTDMSGMFMGCSSITSLNVSSFNTQNVTSVLSMFRDCSSLTSLDVNNFDTRNVTDMRFVFINCSALTSLDLSSFNTQNVTGMHQMFYGCSSLTTLALSNFNTQNVTAMYDMFYGCSSLTSLDLSSFDTHNVTDMSGMFLECSALTTLDLSSFDTHNVTDMYAMFERCSSLNSLDISNFDTKNVADVRYMFFGCSSLQSLDLSNFTTENAEHVDSIFCNCDKLTSIISNVNTPSSLKPYFFDSFDNRANCTLLVPAGTKELYAAADGWNELGIIEEMEDPNRALFGTLWASVSEDENIGVHDLELLQLAYPNTLAGTTGYEKYEMGGVNWDAVATLLDSKGTKIEEAYAHEVDSIGAVEFSAKLKRGEEYTVNVPKGLYNIYNMEDFTSIDSPAETLHYTTDYLLGDVDGDENHSVTDVVGVASYLIKGSDEVGKLVIDCNKDDDATVTDITYLVEKVLTGYFPWEALLAKERAPRTVTTPRLFLDSKDNALGLSFDNSSEFCSMQFDIALTDALGNDITSLGNIRVKAGNGTQGHSITTGIVDGKLRVLVYSLGNKSFKSGDVVTICVDGHDTYTASITNAELTATCFAAVRPDNVEASFSVADGISELSVSGNAQVYDLTGRKLNASTKQGVVITNGKKVSGVRIGK